MQLFAPVESARPRQREEARLAPIAPLAAAAATVGAKTGHGPKKIPSFAARATIQVAAAAAELGNAHAGSPAALGAAKLSRGPAQLLMPAPAIAAQVQGVAVAAAHRSQGGPLGHALRHIRPRSTHQTIFVAGRLGLSSRKRRSCASYYPQMGGRRKRSAFVAKLQAEAGHDQAGTGEQWRRSQFDRVAPIPEILRGDIGGGGGEPCPAAGKS